MSKQDFEPSEFEHRHRQVRKAMEDARIDLLLVISPVNLNYLIGWRGKGYQHFQCLFFARDSERLVFVVKLAEKAQVLDETLANEVRTWLQPDDPLIEVKKVLEEKNYHRLRIGLEAPAYFLAPQQFLGLREILGNSLVLDATYLIENLKLVKSAPELSYIRKAASLADKGLRSFVNAIEEGRTELEIAAEAHKTMMALGSDSPASPMNFGSGERSCYAHALPSERRLKRGDFMHNEFGAAYRRYCATLGRIMCLGEPTKRMHEIYQAVRQASDACIAEIKDGVPAIKPHEAARRVLREFGMEQYQVHTTGYGIAPGFPPAWGESIQMFRGSTATLKAGMVLSVEPPVYIHEERLGARMIDNVVVTETGAEILSKFTREIICI